MLDVRTARKIGRPRRPTANDESSVTAAMRSGGWGFWYGLGTVHPSRHRKYLPSNVNRSSVHAFWRNSGGPPNRPWRPPHRVVEPLQGAGGPRRPTPEPRPP